MALATHAEAMTQLNANLSWEGDVVKARLALEAVRFLMFNRAERSKSGDKEMEFGSLQALEGRLASFVESAGGEGLAGFVRARAKWVRSSAASTRCSPPCAPACPATPPP